jgi:hypothetical protein
MIKTSIIRLIPELLVICAMVFCLALIPRPAQAEDSAFPLASEKFSREELAQMLGPIALYPDKLLAQVLMASTYPIELIEADRWFKKNPRLQGDSLDRALLEMDWAPSVKAICHFPAILALMSERIAETTNLGNAFLVQEEEIMDLVQELRASAYAQGNLTTTPQQKVIVEKETIVIEPASPRVIYVPYYDPYYIFGSWWYPAYPPYYWGPPGIRLGVGISYWPGISFGFSWGSWSYFDWPRHYVHINIHDRPRYVRHDRWFTKSGRWLHAPVHRRGVAYRDKYTARKFNQYPQHRSDFRGNVRSFPERQVFDRQRIRVGDERRRIDRNHRVKDKSQYERSLQEQQRVESELQKRQRLLHQRVDRDLQKRQVIDRDRQRQERRGQERTRIDRAPREQQHAEQERTLRQRTDQQRRGRDSVKGEPSQRRREADFDRQENRRSERQSGERTSFSRQQRNNDAHSKNRVNGRRGRGSDDGYRNRR